MNRGHPVSIIDAKLQEHHISASRRCPSCGHELDCKPVYLLRIQVKPCDSFLGCDTNFTLYIRKEDMIGLPAGVKFDPTDQELIEHLEAKVMEGGSRAHPLIDDFIPTIQGEDGICYTHPEKLPGVTRNGLSKHFFHRPSKAYTTGTRKRRKIQAEYDLPNSKSGAETRWHKTGKTRPLMVAGRQKGCKKILVLYTNFGKHRKPEKTNWVMHQYHLGDLEDEKEGELIVSKVFYQTQPRQNAAVDQRATAGDTESEMPGAMQDGLTGYAIAAAATVEMQRQEQQRLKQADDQFSSAPPEKRLHEFGVDHQVTVDQGGEQHDHHHRPLERHVSSDLQATHVPAACSLTGKRRNLSSPAIQHTSVVLDNQLGAPAMLLPNENFQMNNEKEAHQQHQQKFDHRSAGLEELIMACQSASTKGGTSTPQSQETQWPYHYWPPENQDQHG